MNERNERKNLEELSAYLDGEASNPDEIGRRLDGDPAAARLASELSTLSKELGRLPAPDVHPGFRTRVMANVRETPRVSVRPLLSWRWRAFAAMVVLAPFAAAIWTFWWSPPSVPETNDQRALVRYLLQQDEDAVLDQLAELYVVDDLPIVNGDDYPLEAVDESEWLDVLAMDATFMEWADVVDDAGNAITEDDLLEIETLVLERMTGDATI